MADDFPVDLAISSIYFANYSKTIWQIFKLKKQFTAFQIAFKLEGFVFGGWNPSYPLKLKY